MILPLQPTQVINNDAKDQLHKSAVVNAHEIHRPDNIYMYEFVE